MNADESGKHDTRGRGRPSTGVRVDIRIPPELLAEIDRAAADEQTTRAVIIRQILANGVVGKGWLA